MSLAIRTVAALWLLTGALIGLVAGAGSVLDQPAANFARDPQAILGVGWYYGFLSNIGILLWWTTAVVCVLAGGIVWKLGSRRRGQIVIAVGLVTAWLALDDLFQLHEDVLPRATHLSQESILAGYALVTAGVVWSARSILQRDTGLLLAAAVTFFIGSILFDLYVPWSVTSLVHYEDSLKLFGIVTWCATFVFASLRLLSEGILLASETRNPPIRVTKTSQQAKTDTGTAAPVS